MDGDGFHYDTIQVPDYATYDSLGISCHVDIAHYEDDDHEDD